MERESGVVSRRVYHVSMGVLEASLYAVPISFLALYLLPSLFSLIVAVVLWAVVWVWVMRRSVAKFSETRAAPVADAGEAAQVTVLKYTALASALFLAFVTVSLVYSRLMVFTFIATSGILFFCSLILFAFCLAFCLLGLAPTVRRSVYPAYPGITATFVFALAMAALFFSNLISS